jgi:hypothetical protein
VVENGLWDVFVLLMASPGCGAHRIRPNFSPVLCTVVAPRFAVVGAVRAAVVAFPHSLCSNDRLGVWDFGALDGLPRRRGGHVHRRCWVREGEAR